MQNSHALITLRRNWHATPRTKQEITHLRPAWPTPALLYEHLMSYDPHRDHDQVCVAHPSTALQSAGQQAQAMHAPEGGMHAAPALSLMR